MAGAAGISIPAFADEYQSHVTWQEVNAAGENTVEVNLPDQETKYYQYTYTKPDDYTVVTEKIDNINDSNTNKILFKDFYSNDIIFKILLNLYV